MALHRFSPADAHHAVDIRLHGMVQLRLLDPTPDDLTAIHRQLGVSPRPAKGGEADLLIRFVDRMAGDDRMERVGTHSVCAGDRFLIGHDQRSRRTMEIPFDRLGGPCMLTCESGSAPLPLLVSIINLTALGKGYLPVHASACAADGQGILTSGWTGGGKTGTLLALLSSSPEARFVSDDVVYLAPDGSRMYGLHQALNVKDQYLSQLPAYARQVDRRDRERMRAARVLETMGGALPERARRRWAGTRLGRTLERRLQAHRTVRLTPDRLFGAENCLASHRLDAVVLTTVTEDRAAGQRSGVSVRPLPAEEAVSRILSSTLHEALTLQSYYLEFCFALPGRTNRLIEEQGRLLHTGLTRALMTTPAYLLHHPAPFPIRQAAEVLADALKAGPGPRTGTIPTRDGAGRARSA